MLDYVRGEVDVGSVLDERETGFAPARVAAEQDVFFEIRNVVITTISCLLHDGLEVRVEGGHEALLASRACGLLHALPESVKDNRGPQHVISHIIPLPHLRNGHWGRKARKKNTYDFVSRYAAVSETYVSGK